MAWETRNGKGHYYVITRQIAGIKRRFYVGKGAKGRAAAEQQRARRRQWWEAKAHTLEVDSIMRDYLAMSDAALVAAGYHRHRRGQWRKKRYGDSWGMKNTRKRNATTLAQDVRQQLLMSLCSDEQERNKYRANVAAYEAELLTTSDSPLERGLIQRIATCWLCVELVERKHAAQLTDAGLAVWDAQLNTAAKRYLAAYTALSNTRRSSSEQEATGWAGFGPEQLADAQRSMLAKAYAVSGDELVMPSEHHERLYRKIERAFGDEFPTDDDFTPDDETPPDGAA